MQKQEEILKAASRIVLLKKEITDQRAEITRLQTQLDSLMPWYGLDISMRVKETRSTRVFIGSFPQEWTEEELKQALAQQNRIWTCRFAKSSAAKTSRPVCS